MNAEVELIMEKARLLSPQQQESLLDFVEYLLSKQTEEAETVVDQTGANSLLITPKSSDQNEEK
ncbi:MAG: hypothetical protein ABIP14_10780 [Blastocatellia bacterium]